MEGFIGIVATIIVLAYIVVAIWLICSRETLGGSIGTSIGMTCGGFIIVPLAGVIATVICWLVVVGIVLAIIGDVFGG